MIDLPERPLPSEILRPLILECLLSGEARQMNNVSSHVFNLAKKKGLIDVTRPGPSYQNTNLKPEEEEIVRVILWEFIIQGLIVPGKDAANPDFPWISLTPYGQQCLKGGGDLLPYDPDGYLRTLDDEIPSLDSDIKVYIAESLQCFRRGLMFASTVMLGVAAEKAAILLFDAFIQAHTKKSKKEELERKIVKQRLFKTRYDNFRAQLASLPRTYLPAELADDLEVQLDGVQSWIRTCRNDAGHPTGKTIRRAQAFANLQLFVPYCRRMYDLLRYFEKHPIA